MQQNPVSTTEHSQCIEHIFKIFNIQREPEKCGSQGKRQSNGVNLKMTQILEFSDEDDFKAAIIVLNEIKEKTLKMNKKTGYLSREMETIQKKHGHSQTM